MERLRIEYGTGYMELNVEAFFPCKMPAMRKAARLINQYCSDVRAGAAMVMTSFNTVERTPATCSRFLLRKVLREEWGFVINWTIYYIYGIG